MDTKTLVDQAIEIEKRMKEDKAQLDEIKAKLTNSALVEMENKNIKFKQLFGSQGIFNAAYKEKFEIDNFNALKQAIGDLVEDKVTRKVEVKFDVENKFKKALIAIFKSEFSNEYTIDQVLDGYGLSDKALKTAKKKLKGEYVNDKQVLESLGIKGDVEEELDEIRLIKNYELVSRYFGKPTDEEIEAIKKAVWVEESLAVGLEYEK
jgi:hypothetical protein